jgi:hypothetical protein
MAEACGFGITGAHRGVQQAQGLAVPSNHQRGVQEQADEFAATRANRTQSSGLGMGGVVERGGVLQSQNERVLPHSRQRGPVMGRSNRVGFDGGIFQEPISPFAARTRPAGLRDGSCGLLGESGGDHKQACKQALIGQLRASEFVERPGGGFDGRQATSGCNCFKHLAIEYISSCCTST